MVKRKSPAAVPTDVPVHVGVTVDVKVPEAAIAEFSKEDSSAQPEEHPPQVPVFAMPKPKSKGNPFTGNSRKS